MCDKASIREIEPPLTAEELLKKKQERDRKRREERE
jgi:hypothetical protein